MNITILKYSTENLGDDIQRIALEELLPRVDLRINRDNLKPVEELHAEDKLIVNGWFSSGRHRVWPIRTEASVLYIGFHANDLKVVPGNPVLPIGCRDSWTYSLCRRKNIPAWMSWCATLTLHRPEPVERNGIYFVDLPEKNLVSIPPEIIDQGKRISHFVKEGTDRDIEARKRIELYSKAKLVVTNRLHAALPCIALGTPVVLAPLPYQHYRATSYRHMTWSLDNAPWFEMRPRVAKEEASGMTVAFRKTLELFLKHQ